MVVVVCISWIGVIVEFCLKVVVICCICWLNKIVFDFLFDKLMFVFLFNLKLWIYFWKCFGLSFWFFKIVNVMFEECFIFLLNVIEF